MLTSEGSQSPSSDPVAGKRRLSQVGKALRVEFSSVWAHQGSVLGWEVRESLYYTYCVRRPDLLLFRYYVRPVLFKWLFTPRCSARTNFPIYIPNKKISTPELLQTNISLKRLSYRKGLCKYLVCHFPILTGTQKSRCVCLPPPALTQPCNNQELHSSFGSPNWGMVKQFGFLSHQNDLKMFCFHSRIEIQALYYIVQTHTVQDRAKELLWAKWMLSTLSAESVRLLRGKNRVQCEFRETRRQLDLPNSVEEQTVRTSAETELTLFAFQSCALLEISFLSKWGCSSQWLQKRMTSFKHQSFGPSLLQTMHWLVTS